MTDITKKNETNAAITKPTSFKPVYDGIEQSDMIVPRAGLCQGTSMEQEEYPGVKRGDIYSKLLGESIADPTFIVAKAYKTYTKYDENDELIYRTQNKDEVDPQDLVWVEDENGNGTPPATTTSLDFVLVFKDVAVPHVFSFQKTAFQAGRQLLSLSQMLHGRCFTFGEPKVGENSKKQKYLIPNPKPTDMAPTQQMLSLAASVAQSNVVTDAESAADDIPI